MLRPLSDEVQRCTEPLSARAVGNPLHSLNGVLRTHEDRESALQAVSAFLSLQAGGCARSEPIPLLRSVAINLLLLEDQMADSDVDESMRVQAPHIQ